VEEVIQYSYQEELAVVANLLSNLVEEAEEAVIQSHH
jgi:hypothetical protein